MKKWFKGPVVEGSAMECVDALKRINELEEENYQLKRKNKILRFKELPQDEQYGAERAYRLMKWETGEFINTLDWFRVSYIDKMDVELTELLPFD